MPAIHWKGIFPALTTKFDGNDKLDLNQQAINTTAQLAAGVNGLILGGSLGEASTLRIDEKEVLLKSTLEVANAKVPVLLNIAESSTADAIKQAVNAEQWGADGIMLLPPLRYSSDARETVTYFKEVAKAIAIPIIIYNNPVDYKTEITLDMFEQLASYDNIQAVKESTRQVSNVTKFKNRFGDRFKILCGVDTIATEEIMMGAEGWVGGLVCAFPAETVAIYRLIKNNRFEEALKIHRWFLPLLELDLHPKLVQYIKLAETRTGQGTEAVRAPRLVLTGQERENVLKIIDDAIATRPTLPDYLSLNT